MPRKQVRVSEHERRKPHQEDRTHVDDYVRQQEISSRPPVDAAELGPSMSNDLQDNLRLVAKDKGLYEGTVERFTEFYTVRGFPNDPHYMADWADRFLKQSEFYRSDLEGQRLLLAMHGSGSRHYLEQNQRYGSWSNLDVLRVPYKWKTGGHYTVEEASDAEVEAMKSEWVKKNPPHKEA
jgi:hypothetical protein